MPRTGIVIMIRPIPGSPELLVGIRELPRPPRREGIGGQLPLVIGIDGMPAAGKSGLARWLGWQLGIAIVELDLYRAAATNLPEWHYDHLRRVIGGRTAARQPLIIEGVFLCDALSAIDLEPYLLILVRKINDTVRTSESVVRPYIQRVNPEGRADF